MNLLRGIYNVFLFDLDSETVHGNKKPPPYETAGVFYILQIF